MANTVGTVSRGIAKVVSPYASHRVTNEAAFGGQALSEYLAMQAIAGDNSFMQIIDLLMDSAGLKGLAKTARHLGRYAPVVGTLFAAADFADSVNDAVNGIIAADNKNRDDYSRRLQEYGYATNPDNNIDYDMLNAYMEGLKPDNRGHYSDKWKKSNHRTFSNESLAWKEALTAALNAGYMTEEAYNKLTGKDFHSWYADDQGRTHYVPQLYQYNDPEWQKYMKEQEGDVIVDAPIEGSMSKPLSIVISGGKRFTPEEKLALMPKYDYESPFIGYGRKILQDGREIANGLAAYATAVPGLLSNGLAKNAGNTYRSYNEDNE